MEIDGAPKVGSSFRFWERWPAGFCNPRPSRRWRAWLSLRYKGEIKHGFGMQEAEDERQTRQDASYDLRISIFPACILHTHYTILNSLHRTRFTWVYQHLPINVRVELPECSECSQAAVVISWPSMGPKMSQCLTLIDSSTHRCCRGFSGDYRRSCSSVAGLEENVTVQVGITDVVTVHGKA